jgi:hypothetical protein
MARMAVDTTVDSETARHYLEECLAGACCCSDRDWKLDAIHAAFGGRAPSTQDLAEKQEAIKPADCRR